MTQFMVWLFQLEVLISWFVLSVIVGLLVARGIDTD